MLFRITKPRMKWMRAFFFCLSIFWIVKFQPAVCAPAPISEVAPGSRQPVANSRDAREAEHAFDVIFDGVSPSLANTLYQADQDGFPLVNAIFVIGDDEARLHVLERMAKFLDGLPLYGSLFARANSTQLGLVSRPKLDQLNLPTASKLAKYRMFPMEENGSISITTGSAQQFSHLASTILRLGVASHFERSHENRASLALSKIYHFLIHDTLELYWTAMPAWHWAGAFPNMRARTLARLREDPLLNARHFFLAFTDYDLQIFAISADLVVAQLHRPQLIRSAEERALADEVYTTGFEVLRRRIEIGPLGESFLFDRGYWDDNPVATFGACITLQPPTAPCPRAGYVGDVSHGQRWPFWLLSYWIATQGLPQHRLVAKWRHALARQVLQKVIRFDRAGHPIMSNFLDGSDGWYLVSASSGHRPSSLTGWSMRYGNWALLSPLAPAIGAAYASFCKVIESTDKADIAFRTANYGAPGPSSANGYQSVVDDFGASSRFSLYCRLYADLGLQPRSAH